MLELERDHLTDIAGPNGLASGTSSMEVDTPGPSALSQALTDNPISSDDLMLNPLKRCNSAPMINALVAASTVSTLTSVSSLTALSSTTLDDGKPLERVRRFSTSSMALNSTPIKVPSRLVQIKREETMAQTEIEAAHEREIQSTIQMSQSMEEIFVDESTHQTHSLSSVSGPGPGPPVDGKRPKSLGEPLHIHVSQYYPYASSPSPTRVGKQCFSPSLQQPVYRTGALTPSPSPSPTRKSFASPLSRRSLSPITLRPSPLGNPGTKRKMDLDGERIDMFCSPAKRFLASYSPGGVTTDNRGHQNNHHQLNSISSGSSDVCNSPDQRVPNVSTTSSPASFFRPVRHSTDSRGTDSETSDMTEATDMSEPIDMSSQLSESVVVETRVLSSTSMSSLSPLTQRQDASTTSSPSLTSSLVSGGIVSSATTESSSGLSQTMSTMSVSPVPASPSASSPALSSSSSSSSSLYSSSIIPPPASTITPSTLSVSATTINYFSQNKVTEV